MIGVLTLVIRWRRGKSKSREAASDAGWGCDMLPGGRLLRPFSAFSFNSLQTKTRRKQLQAARSQSQRGSRDKVRPQTKPHRAGAYGSQSLRFKVRHVQAKSPTIPSKQKWKPLSMTRVAVAIGMRIAPVKIDEKKAAKGWWQQTD